MRKKLKKSEEDLLIEVFLYNNAWLSNCSKMKVKMMMRYWLIKRRWMTKLHLI